MQNIPESYNTSIEPIKLRTFNEDTINNYVIVANKEHLYSELQSEGVILSLTNGKYYGVNEVGASIWARIQNPTTFNDIHSYIMQEYEVESDVCKQQILEFLKKMSEEDLIEIINEKAL